MAAKQSDIPDQIRVPWTIAGKISWAGLRRRLLRGMITMAGVVLAIAFLSYMLVTDDITDALVALQNEQLNLLLQKAGVDVYGAGEEDSMMFLLLGLSLFTALVGILNSMIMAVAERIREIGTLKCLGATDRFIVKSYFIESSLQGVLGALLGTILGLIVAVFVATINYGGYVLQSFPALQIIVAMGMSLIVGGLIAICASILPAYMAAKKEPVEALRVEE